MQKIALPVFEYSQELSEMQPLLEGEWHQGLATSAVSE